MLFWRLFLTSFGLLYGVILGLYVVATTQWLDGLPIVLLAGALLGAACGWTILPIMPKAVQRLRERFPPDAPPLPPPPGVLRLGLILGIAEGVVVGASYGGATVAVFGGFAGMAWGPCVAVLSWRVRRQISLVLLALLVGFLIEVAGCLLIGGFIKGFADMPPVMCAFCAVFAVGLSLRLHRQFRGFTPARQDESFGASER